MPIYKVLVPLDDSKFSRQILPYMRKFLHPVDTTVILLRVAPRSQEILEPSPVTEPHESELPVQSLERPFWVKEIPPYPEQFSMYASQEWERVQATVEDELAPDVKNLKEAGYIVSAVVRFGDPAEEILTCIQDEDVDLVAMTTHSRSGLSRLLYGSVASEVLHQARVPLLLYRPIEDASAPDRQS